MKRLERFASALFPIVLLGTLAAATFWLAKATQLPEPDRSGKFRHDPDYFVDNLTMSRLDKQGTLRSTVTGKHLVHYPDTDETDVEQPTARFYKPGRPTVTMSSDVGHINSDGSEVKLTHNVKVVRDPSKEREAMVATAPDLLVYPDAETAHTPSQVRMVQGKSWVQGHGLRVDNATMTTILESRVTGQFASKHEKR
ncbi:LPS export ABC transporter periplasmic protein LptC [Azospira sp. I13]|uniref:LPS export ABC transporter periplasmic protein LptC n=1 Tax=Azospira sp. I13 TaxID=1765050 RepID=UPI000D4511E4|nr:LPS export ABC transporter periplasmic protein LptC [Azospira sp. I13]GBG01145.1 LPS export ABC transporter periplasmic protein LptC [Azospira sp. I13]